MVRMIVRSSAIRILILFVALAFPLDTPGHKDGNVEKISGAVVAYDEIQATWIPCYDDVCEGSLVVRVDTPNEANVGYILVNFKYRAGSFPKELIRGSREWQFKLQRNRQRDEPLYEYVIKAASSYSAEKRYPIWKLVPGAESEKLPFEQKLPSYTLAKGGFKVAKKKSVGSLGAMPNKALQLTAR
jgi:hypothetical protein